MKRYIFIFVAWFCVPLICSDDLTKSVALVTHLQQHADYERGITGFCQSVIDSFGLPSLDVALVLNRFKGQALVVIPKIEFESYDQFVAWSGAQVKTLLFVYEPGSIRCEVCHEYLLQLQDAHPEITIVRVAYDDFVAQVVMGQDQQNPLILSLEAVPDVLLVQQGEVWQLQTSEVLSGLKSGIDRLLEQ